MVGPEQPKTGTGLFDPHLFDPRLFDIWHAPPSHHEEGHTLRYRSGDADRQPQAGVPKLGFRRGA